MAQSSMKDIRQRIRSVENTMQITKAMQLVASSKLRGARKRMENSRPFLQEARQAVRSLAGGQRDSHSIYLNKQPSEAVCLVVIAGDRGLAGSYNANVFKLAEEWLANKTASVMPLGRKAREYYAHRGYTLLPSELDKVDGAKPEQCEVLARRLMEGYKAGEYGEVYIAYTTFQSVLTQRAKLIKVLPIDPPKEEKAHQMLFEGSVDALLEGFLPQYLSGILYAAICDSVVSEQAARRVAMDAATKNASEMIDDLTLRFNRARQGSITQELTEIVAGAESQ